VWTPKRILLLTLGFGLFSVAYLIYAHFLGGIDGLPPLPDDFRPIFIADNEAPEPPPLPQSETSADQKLRQAFGDDCKELGYKVKLELQKKGMVLAAGDFKIQPDGKVLLEPFSLAIFGKPRADGKDVEINTVQSLHAILTFDKPISNITDMNNRKIVRAELRDEIYVINNRRTPQRDDDLSLFTQGPLYYQESLHLIWTDKTVRLIDLQSKPNPTTIDGTQMYVYLTPETKPAKPGQPLPQKADRSDSANGVDRIELRRDVNMNLWVDKSSGFLASDKKEDPQKPAAQSKPKTTKEPAQPEKVKVVISTQGPFSYDLHTHHATFDKSKISGPRQNVVTVDRINEAEGNIDHLQCDRLELQFRPNKEQGQKDPKEQPNAESEGLDIENARATGQEVVLTSDAEVLEARGDDFFYDKIKSLSTLRGTPRMWALKEGNEIEAPELQLLNLKGNQQATALGTGVIRMLDKATGKRTLAARWEQRLVYAKDGANDMLTLIGNAAFVDTEHQQELRADVLKVWLQPADPADSSSKDQQGRKPQHLEATGNIKSVGPDMNVHNAEHLVVWFKDAPPIAQTQGTPSSNESPSQTPPAQPPLGQPRTGASTKKADGSSPTKDASSAPTEPAKPKQPIDLTARSIDAHVLRSGAKNDLDKLWCQGRVHVHQDPATPEEKGVDIRGETLELTHEVDGNILAVTGDHAQVQMDKIFILGPEVHIDQTSNKVWVNGMGIMKMPSNANFDGTKSAQTAELTVNWEKKMDFDGLNAQYFGNIRAEQNEGHLACQNMQVVLDHMVSLREGNKKAAPAKVEKLLCDRDVWVEDATMVDGKISSYKRMDCRELAVDNDPNTEESQAQVAGPGKVRIFQLGQKDNDLSPSPNRSAAPTKDQRAPTQGQRKGGPQPQGGPKSDEQHKLTHVSFQSRMTANNKRGMATFYDRVIVIDVPTEDPDLKIDEDRPPKESMFISCERLEVLNHKLPDGTSKREMRAYNKVVIEEEKYSGRADIVKYDESKQQIILEGVKGNFAELYKQDVRGQEGSHIIGKKITYYRDTGLYKVDDAQSLSNTR